MTTALSAPLSAPLLLGVVLGYFAVLLAIAWFTSRGADDHAFFVGDRRSSWLLVAFGMVGTSLSGVTFVSVPGAVGMTGFTYLQIVFGHVLGYWVVAFVLLPLYHRLGLTSIYGLLLHRLGRSAHRTGSGLFIVARTLGATARLYLVIRILQWAILERLGVPFVATAALLMTMILLYTIRGGVRTIVFTDTLQTAAMLAGLAVCVALLLDRLGLGAADALQAMRAQGLARLIGTDPFAADFFAKQVLAGAFITIAMTGMDQEMMQKSISIARLRDAQKNLLLLSVVLLAVVAAFVYLGGLLHLAARAWGVAAQGDALFPTLVMERFSAAVQLLFVVALISALFPSADGALTALTASTCVDLLRLPERAWSDARRRRVRHAVHLGFAALFMVLVLVFEAIASPSMIGLILRIAAYTYGPLLGLFAFALFNAQQRLPPRAVPLVALAAPALTWLIDRQQAALFGPWRIGLEILLVNGALTWAGLRLAARRRPSARHGHTPER